MSSVMQVCSSALRGAIIAPRGRKLVVSDLSNIEGRTLAWLAGEQWKLDAFRAFDAGDGPDLYKLAYARAFQIHADAVDKSQRQVGKVMELALGYQGGVGAFCTFARAYGIDLDELAALAGPTVSDEVMDRAAVAYQWTLERRKPTHGLSEHTWLVCDALKQMWRLAHPQTAALWPEVEQAARLAMAEPGTAQTAGPLLVRRDGAWLRIRLPSGRYLCYPGVSYQADPDALPGEDADSVLTYMGQNQQTRKWQRLYTYGGKLVENVTQAVACDVLASPMPSIDAAGYQIVLSVHDELITETPDTPEYTVAELSRRMATPPEWAPDLPLAAAGFESYRYRKD